MFNSVRARLTLWCVGIYGLLLLLFSVGVYALAARGLHDRIDASLRSFSDAAEVSLIRETAEGETPQEAAVSTVEELNVLPDQAIVIFSQDGRLLAQRGVTSSQFAERPPTNQPVQPASLDASLARIPERHDDHKMVVTRPSIADRRYVVVVSQTASSIDEELEVLRRVLYASVPSAIGIAAVAAWFLVRKSLTPLAIMSDQAHGIGAQNLDERLLVPNPHDELGRLASSFNELLTRLSAAFHQQRQFMADASHELRTPLSVISTAAEVTLEREPRTELEYREAFTIVGHEAQRLRQIVEDMFTLARVDANHRIMRPAPLYLDELATESVQAAHVLGERKRVAVRFASSSEAPYTGDEGLLRRMLLNLLDNAIRHTASGGSVDVELERTAADYVLAVRDSGEGIPIAAQPHVFERFYQADVARSYGHTGAGAGLGLPIARWVAEVHSGSLELQHSDDKGSTFIVRLPLPPPSA